MRIREESGQALIITVLAFGVLMGFAGLAVDSGVLFHAKRNLQIAADAAATAGALDYLYNQSQTSAVNAAKGASSVNGFANGAGGVTVTVNTPPASGPAAGSTGSVEAIVSKPVPMTFMSLFGISTMTVKARAVAGTPTTGGTACIWLMNATGTDLYLQGSYDIEAPTCGVYMNSTSSNAVSVTGNGGTLHVLFADDVGGSIGHQTAPTAITTNAGPRKNPWGNITGPDPTTGSGCTTWDTTTTTLTGNIAGPGAGATACYSKAVTLNNATIGTGTLSTTSISNNTVNSPAGTLAFGNGVTISGTVTVFGGTIDVANGTFNQPSNTLLNDIAPTSGTYDGIAIMQPATNSNLLQVQRGSNNQVFVGYIYAPGAQVYLQDSGGGITASGIVADSMKVKTGQITVPSYDLANPSTTRNRIVSLLE